jgi:hypothetical protein
VHIDVASQSLIFTSGCRQIKDTDHSLTEIAEGEVVVLTRCPFDVVLFSFYEHPHLFNESSFHILALIIDFHLYLLYYFTNSSSWLIVCFLWNSCSYLGHQRLIKIHEYLEVFSVIVGVCATYMDFIH